LPSESTLLKTKGFFKNVHGKEIANLMPIMYKGNILFNLFIIKHLDLSPFGFSLDGWVFHYPLWVRQHPTLDAVLPEIVLA
jgi:hypothetical protein